VIIERKDRLNIALHGWLAKLQAKLHVNPSKIILLDWDIVDASGVPIKKHTGRSHSVVRNYNNMQLQLATITDGTYGTTYADGSSCCWKPANSALCTAQKPVNSYGNITAAAGDTTYGILVGTSDTAESFENYKIGTLITHGATSGKLSYSTTTSTTTWTSGTKTFANAIQRVFTNNSGGTITINEICIYDTVNCPKYAGAASDYICLLRDVTPIELLATQVATITYTISYVLP
jgi:hypothetical protein